MNFVVSWIVTFFGNQEVQTFLTQYIAEKALDYGKDKMSSVLNKKVVPMKRNWLRH